MKNIALLLIIISATFFNVAKAEEKWVKSTNGCTVWWDASADDVFKAVEWSGKCKDGYASGDGVAKYHMTDGTEDVFQGSMKKGKLDGDGRYKWSNGGTYAGELKNGKMHGQGIRTWPNGDRYVGSWKQHQKHGKGTVTWGNPCPTCYKSFVGNFDQNKYTTGMYTLASGEKVAKKEDSLSKLTSTYLQLITGYSVNRHAHHGN